VPLPDPPHPVSQPEPARPPSDSRSRVGDESETGFDGLTTAAGLTRQPPAADPLPGTVVGGVRIVRLLAEGGMGRVYEGIQEQPARAVAVKVLRPVFVTDEARRRFRREAEILGTLDHPGIARIHTAGSCDILGTSLPYLVMELVPGARPLVAYADAEGLDVPARVALLADVCDAVAAGHARGIIHRDLKPGNVLVDVAGRPRVIDFGVARWLDAAADDAGLTTTGQFIGTLRYTSPEQLPETRGPVDARSDVYSLGVMLYELLVGRPSPDLPGRRGAVTERPGVGGTAAGLRRMNPAVTPALERVVARCLARKPADRFPDAAVLAAALRGVPAPGSVHWTSRRVAVAGILGAAVGVPAAVALTMRRVAGPVERSFRFDLREPPGPEVVRADRARINREPFGAVVYWGPEVPDAWAEIVYRLDVPFPIASVSFAGVGIFAANVHAEVSFDALAEAHLEVSPDGERWTPLEKSTPRAPLLRDDAAAAAAMLGARTVFLRARLYESTSFNRNRVHYAQFLRSEPDLGRMPVLTVSRSAATGPSSRRG